MRALLVMLLLAVPAGVHARGARPDRRAEADSSRVLPAWLQGSLEIGPGWLQTPASLRSRYSPGLSAAAQLAVSPAKWLALGLRGDYTDLPAGVRSDVPFNSSVGLTLRELGHGYATGPLATAAARLAGDAWLEAGLGVAYFKSGFQVSRGVVPAAVAPLLAPGSTGWGRATDLAFRWEFRPTARDRLFLSARAARVDRDGQALGLASLRLGYRLP